jgi:hypothetical protein
MVHIARADIGRHPALLQAAIALIVRQTGATYASSCLFLVQLHLSARRMHVQSTGAVPERANRIG